MEISGFAGRVLHVDLTSGKAWKEPLDPDLIDKFVGGWGIALRMLWDLVPPETEPLSPENVIIIATAPFVGTYIPGASRVMALYKGPLNNTYTPSSGGGLFGALLKSSGYDYLVIHGRSEKPVYLRIVDEDGEICDSGYLWGKDIFETVYALRKKYEPCSIIAIGPSGENLVNISVTQVDQGGGSLGEGGLCAVMGSKNLKAIVAMQGTRGIRVADRVKLQMLTDKMLNEIITYPLRKELIAGGSMAMTMSWIGSGGRFYDNYTGVEPVTAEDRANASAMLTLHKQSRRHIACPSCPMGDKDRVDYDAMTTYDTAIMPPDTTGIGPKCSYKQLLEYTDLVNRYGIDKLQFEPIVSLMAHLYHAGLITNEDTGGIEINDDFDTIMRLAKTTALREGFGDILADGILGATRRLGRGLDKYAVQIKGYSRMLDPRMYGLGTMQFSQVVNPRGSGAVQGGMGAASYNLAWPVEKWVKAAKGIVELPDDVVERIFTPDSFNVARLTKHNEDWFSVMNCLGLCYRLYIYRFYNIRTIGDLYCAVTGIDISPARLLNAGEKAWNLYKLLNVRAGYSRKDDMPPEAWFTPVKERGGPEYFLTDYYRRKIITKEDFERLLDDYYEERGWDIETGTPTSDKLEELSLGGL